MNPGLLLATALSAQTPGPRLGHAMVYDESSRRVLLVDGAFPEREGASAGLWSWDGKHWGPVTNDGPTASSMGAAAYDSKRNLVVTYGGVLRGHAFLEVHEWRGTWKTGSDTAAGARYHHGMSYDAARNKTVMYGGAVAGRWDPDTWTWDGTRWERITVPGPGPRAAFRMVYDSRRQEVVLFGGVSAPDGEQRSQRYLGDTWVWNGVTWRKASESGPTGRRDHSMTFDTSRGVVLLYGGAAGSGAATKRFDDMWKWDGTRWTQIGLGAPNPGHRYVAAMAYDASRDRTVLYGGYSCAPNGSCGVRDDTWEWDGARWTQLDP